MSFKVAGMRLEDAGMRFEVAYMSVTGGQGTERCDGSAVACLLFARCGGLEPSSHELGQ